MLDLPRAYVAVYEAAEAPDFLYDMKHDGRYVVRITAIGLAKLAEKDERARELLSYLFATAEINGGAGRGAEEEGEGARLAGGLRSRARLRASWTASSSSRACPYA